jgi:hypothetical protein
MKNLVSKYYIRQTEVCWLDTKLPSNGIANYDIATLKNQSAKPFSIFKKVLYCSYIINALLNLNAIF